MGVWAWSYTSSSGLVPGLWPERCRSSIYETGWLPARAYGAVVKEPDLIAPAIPTLLRLASEELDVRAGDKPLDPLPNTIGFPAVLAASVHYQASHVPGLARRLAACREQTEFRIGTCPVAHADEEMGRVFIVLHPAKPKCLVFETPRPNELQRSRQQGVSCPQK
jgi:hypothetical protein